MVVIQTYTRLGVLMRWSLCRALRSLGTDHADVLLLGWCGMQPAEQPWVILSQIGAIYYFNSKSDPMQVVGGSKGGVRHIARSIFSVD